MVLSLVMILSLAGCGVQKHRGFMIDGDVFSAQVNDGELVLSLRKDSESDTWACKGESNLFAIDNCTELDNSVEFHIVSLGNGSDTIAVNHVLDDGSVETYNLAIKISGHPKTQLLIDSVTFVKAD